MNGNGAKAAAIRDALDGMSRPAIAAKYGMSDGWAGGVITESGRSGRMTKVRPSANGGSSASGVSPPPMPAPRAIAPRKPQRGKPRWPLVVIVVLGDLIVLAVTLRVSYAHVRHLAEIAGQGDLSAWYPLGVDGLVLVCAGVLVWDQVAGRATSRVAQA